MGIPRSRETSSLGRYLTSTWVTSISTEAAAASVVDAHAPPSAAVAEVADEEIAAEEVAAPKLHQCKTELRRRLLLQERQQQQPRRTRLFTKDGMCGTTTNRGNDVDHVGTQVREMVKRTESMATSSTISTSTDVVDASSPASAHSHHPPTLPPSQNHRGNIHRFLIPFYSDLTSTSNH